MKVYKFYIKKYNDFFYKTVFASNIEKAIINFKRWYKKNNYSSDPNIISVEVIHEVDIYYKS